MPACHIHCMLGDTICNNLSVHKRYTLCRSCAQQIITNKVNMFSRVNGIDGYLLGNISTECITIYLMQMFRHTDSLINMWCWEHLTN